MKKMSLILSLAIFASLSVSQAQAGRFGRLRCQSSSSCCPAPACYTAAPVYASPATRCSAPAAVCAQPVYAAPTCGSCDGITYASPTDLVLNAAPVEYATPSPMAHGETAQQPVPAAPAPAPVASYREVFAAFSNYLANKKIEICDFKSMDPRYKAIVENELTDGERLEGGTVCFPNEAAWNARPEIAAEIVAIFKSKGIL